MNATVLRARLLIEGPLKDLTSTLLSFRKESTIVAVATATAVLVVETGTTPASANSPHGPDG
jgi:hypothetical protein